MRDRHFPRVCRSCAAPLARQENACWRCGTDWASEDERPTTLRVLRGEAQTGLAVSRWIDEGGAWGLSAGSARTVTQRGAAARSRRPRAGAAAARG
jgi:hypothetical protein